MSKAREWIGAFRQNKAASLIILAALLVLLIFTFKRTRLTTNPLSRISTVERLVEAGTFELKSPLDSTRFPISIDHVKVGQALYSSKPPTYPLVMAAEAKAVKAVTGWNFFEHKGDFVRILTLLNQVLPYVLMLVLAFFLILEITRDKWTIAFMLASLSFGMLPFGYAVTINNHTISAVLLFIAFILSLKAARSVKGGIFPAFFAGLISGFAVANDLVAGTFLILFLFILLKKSPVLALSGILAMLIPILISSWIYYDISGSIKPFYLQGKLYRYEGAYWTRPESLDAQHDPRGTYIFHALLGHHGLFSMTPLFFLVVAAIPGWIRNKAIPLRKEFFGILLCSVVIILFGLFRTHNYGGWCIGLRWYISFMPLLMIGAIPIVERLGKKPAGIVLCLVLLLLSLPWNFEALWWEAFVRSSLEIYWP